MAIPGATAIMTTPVQVFTPASEQDFERYFDLRWRVLRAPWQQPRGSERDALDTHSWHRMACLAGREPVGVARLHLIDPATAQIRYMAVEPAFQRRGIGRALTRALEEQAMQLGAGTIVLHARETCVGFYERLGYEVLAPAHTLFGAIPHHEMRKRLL